MCSSDLEVEHQRARPNAAIRQTGALDQELASGRLAHEAVEPFAPWPEGERHFALYGAGREHQDEQGRALHGLSTTRVLMGPFEMSTAAVIPEATAAAPMATQNGHRFHTGTLGSNTLPRTSRSRTSA